MVPGLAYQREVWDTNIWRLLLLGSGVASGLPAKLIASTRLRYLAPQYSPNGKRIAFESGRSGVEGIWVSDADGSNPRNCFHAQAETAGPHADSPDGQRIAFDYKIEGNFDIYVIRVIGGKPIPCSRSRFRKSMEVMSLGSGSMDSHGSHVFGEAR